MPIMPLMIVVRFMIGVVAINYHNIFHLKVIINL